MKIKLVAIFVFVFVSFSSFSQQKESKRYLRFKKKYNYREGYVINNDSSIIEGLLKIGSSSDSRVYSSLTFVSKAGDKSKYMPSDLKGFGYSFYEYISDHNKIYKIEQKGRKVSLYVSVSTSSWTSPGAPGMGPATYSTSSEDFYVKKPDDDEFKLVRKKKFAKQFSDYFSDCEEVKEDILKEKLTHKDIEKIVRKYNFCD